MYKIFNILGPPARDFRYCCKILKLAPITESLKKLSDETLSIIGQRKFESLQRVKLSKISKSKWVVDTLVIAPIHEWTALHVWLYIFDKKLPYNKGYEKGFDRIGCWLCPANELAEFELIKMWYPELMNWWETILEEYRLSHSLPEEWVKYGLWRWREKYPGDFRRFMNQVAKIELINTYRPKYVEINHQENEVHVKLSNEVNLSKLIQFIKILPTEIKYIDNDEIILLHKDSEIKLLINKSNVVIRGRVDSNLQELLIKTIVRSSYCTGCRLCMSWCYRNAIKFVNDVVEVYEELCEKCLRCLNILSLIHI